MISEEFKQHGAKIRQALLAEVDSWEILLGMERTAELRERVRALEKEIADLRIALSKSRKIVI